MLSSSLQHLNKLTAAENKSSVFTSRITMCQFKQLDLQHGRPSHCCLLHFILFTVRFLFQELSSGTRQAWRGMRRETEKWKPEKNGCFLLFVQIRQPIGCSCLFMLKKKSIKLLHPVISLQRFGGIFPFYGLLYSDPGVANYFFARAT